MAQWLRCLSWPVLVFVELQEVGGRGSSPSAPLQGRGAVQTCLWGPALLPAAPGRPRAGPARCGECGVTVGCGVGPPQWGDCGLWGYVCGVGHPHIGPG